MTHFLKWLYVIFIAASALTTISIIDEPREPISKKSVIIIILVDIILIIGILRFWK